MRALIAICLLLVSATAQRPVSIAEFSLPKLDGQTLRSDDLKDRIVVLDLLATESPQRYIYFWREVDATVGKSTGMYRNLWNANIFRTAALLHLRYLRGTCSSQWN